MIISEDSPCIKYQLSESAQLIYIGGLSTKYNIGDSPLLISEGSPQIITNIFVKNNVSHTWLRQV